MSARSSTFWTQPEPLVLASGSAARAQMLGGAGLSFEIIKPEVDERALEAPLREESAGGAVIAGALAIAKAREVSLRHRSRYVLGGDQTLQIGDELLSKPEGRAGARAHLQMLSGRLHQLHSAAVLVRDGEVLLQVADVASLTMRSLSEAFIEAYLDAAGEAIFGSVGAYQIEGLGVHLFERVEGEHATIMGLPLSSLIKGLRGLSLLRG